MSTLILLRPFSGWRIGPTVSWLFRIRRKGQEMLERERTCVVGAGTNYNVRESGIRIQKLRKKKGLTQEQLAELMNISCSGIAKIERGAKGASIDLLIDLAELFDVSLDYLVLGKGLNPDRMRKKMQRIAAEIEEMASLL